MEKKKVRLNKSDLLMASAACAWGFSYIFMKWGLGCLTPSQIVMLRFGIAFPFLLLILRKKVWPSKTEVKYSALLAVMVFALSMFYNYGLKTTEASTAGFLAGTTVAMVPIINGILQRKFPEKKVLLSVVLALGGVALMSVTAGFTIEGGAWLCLAGACSYAVQIIITNRALAKDCRSLVIGVWQLGFTSLYGLIAAVILGEMRFSMDTMGWIGILGLAFISSAYGYIAQTVAQKKVTPERIGFLYSLEPVFCAVLAFLFFGELMSLKEIAGAVMIFLSILL